MIINNIRNTTVNVISNTPQQKPMSGWQQQLLQSFREYITGRPVKELSREVRSFFLLHLSGLTTIPAGFEDTVLKMLVILETMDEAADKEVYGGV